MNRFPWVAHFGITRTPFTQSIAAKDLYRRAAHDEAVARIGFLIAESALGVLTGEVGVGSLGPRWPPRPPSCWPPRRPSAIAGWWS